MKFLNRNVQIDNQSINRKTTNINVNEVNEQNRNHNFWFILLDPKCKTLITSKIFLYEQKNKPTCTSATLFVGRNSHIIDQRINHIKQTASSSSMRWRLYESINVENLPSSTTQQTKVRLLGKLENCCWWKW